MCANVNGSFKGKKSLEKRKKLKILVVDDDEEILWLIQQFLDEHKVYTAQNGKKGFEIYKEVKPDLVLMDIVMPVMDGIEATRKIIEVDPTARIVVITAFASTDKAYNIKKAGAIKIIDKPTEMKVILKNVEKYAR